MDISLQAAKLLFISLLLLLLAASCGGKGSDIFKTAEAIDADRKLRRL